MNVLSQILKHKIVAIIRGAVPADVSKIVEAIHAGGIKLVEITMNSPGTLELIEKISSQMNEKMLVGAGTVLDAETAKAAIQAGAKFIISPSTNPATIEMTKNHNIVSIPGAFTPTEILSAFSHGGDIIKVFPARMGPDYIRDIRGPLPHIPLMPTGGVNLDNIAEFQKAGAVAFGIGTSLVNTKQKVTDEYLLQLRDTAAKFVKAIADRN
jgi:2-dehydro-3-deoxyphosphogluconate aldolase/(4S)-4-hydroxy-2-oxoglutarate aldolase